MTVSPALGCRGWVPSEAYPGLTGNVPNAYPRGPPKTQTWGETSTQPIKHDMPRTRGGHGRATPRAIPPLMTIPVVRRRHGGTEREQQRSGRNVLSKKLSDRASERDERAGDSQPETECRRGGEHYRAALRVDSDVREDDRAHGDEHQVDALRGHRSKIVTGSSRLPQHPRCNQDIELHEQPKYDQGQPGVEQ